MLWLRNKDNNNIYSVDPESVEYSYLRRIMSSVDSRPLYEELGLQEVTADQANLPLNNFVIAKYVSDITVASDTVNTSLGLSPCDGTLIALALTTQTTQAGQATNYRTLSMFDDGSPANSGASYAQISPVSMATEAFNSSAVTMTTGTELVLSITSAAVSANDILRFASVPSGTGMAFSDFVVLATFSRKS